MIEALLSVLALLCAGLLAALGTGLIVHTANAPEGVGWRPIVTNIAISGFAYSAAIASTLAVTS